jgi:hypothetical protein
MAQLVWRYTAQDPATAHLVYTTASERNPGQTVLAAVSRCGEVDAESAERWRGSSPRAAKRLEGLRPCLHCVALVDDVPELVATSP